MSEQEETLDEELAVERLNVALSLQLRSALQYSLTAASLVGFEIQAVGAKLTQYGDEELADARRLIEKIVSLGGTPTTDVAELRAEGEPGCCDRLAHRVRERGGRSATGGDRADGPRGALGGARAHARAHDHAQAGPGRLPRTRPRHAVVALLKPHPAGEGPVTTPETE